MPTGRAPSTLRVGLTSIKPGDGAIVAMYGGKDYQKEQFNTATEATMQAGSTFKIFALLAALSRTSPISTNDQVRAASPQYFKEFEDTGAATDFLRRGGVRNFGPSGEQFGTIDLRRGHRPLGQHRLRPAQHQGRAAGDRATPRRRRPARRR